MKKIKKYCFDLLDPEDIESSAEKVVNWFILVLICLNTLAVMIEPNMTNPSIIKVLQIFELFSVVFFSVEYILRVWVSDYYYPSKSPIIARVKYVFSPMALIDLIAILPFYLPFLIAVDLRVLRSLRLFRLFRLFKANRYVKSLNRVISVLRKKSSELVSSIAVVLILMIISATIMFYFEHDAQPDAFTSMFDALWWSIATLTTVGYGDIYPVTAIGKLFAGIIALLGIGIVAIPTGIIASGFTEAVTQEEAVVCPHCGKVIEK